MVVEEGEEEQEEEAEVDMRHMFVACLCKFLLVVCMHCMGSKAVSLRLRGDLE